MKIIRIGLCAAASALAGFCLAAEMDLMQPLPEEPAADRARAVASVPAEPWVVRTTRVQLAPNFAEICRNVMAGDVLRLGLFGADASGAGAASVRVRPGGRARVSRAGGVSVSGKLEGAELRTVVITVADNRVLGTIEDLAAGRVYQLTGDLASGIGEVTELDPLKMPPKQYLPPLIPPGAGEGEVAP